MRKKDIFLLAGLLSLAFALIFCSSAMRQGAYEGLVLAENTIIPSLLPLLMIFMLIMNTGARDVLSRLFGSVCVRVFNLPKVAFPALFFGLVGGYPTGALLTGKLFDNQEISSRQARRMLCFNFCGGCGFIITAVGGVRLMSVKAGVILFVSNVISSLLVGFLLSFREKRIKSEFYSFNESTGLGDAVVSSVEGAVKSVLSITAFVMLFGALDGIVSVPDFLLPFIEITNGVCKEDEFSLPVLSAYLAFGGLCIHLQILPVILKCGMRYGEFLLSRIAASLLSYCTAKVLLAVFPVETAVFSNSSSHLAVFSKVNLALSLLLIIGCFVLVLDLSSRKKYA